MFNLWLVRVPVFITVLLFALIDLGLSAGFISKLHHFDDGIFIINYSAPDFASLNVAVSVITLLTLGLMLGVDFVRRGAVTSWIFVELIATGILWILWLAAAADTTGALNGDTVDCTETGGDIATVCREYQGMQAFTYLNWIFLMAYFGLLLTFAIIGHVRGHDSWRTTVRDADFGSNGNDPAVPMTEAVKTEV